MTCHDALTLLEDYVDQELSAGTEAQLKKHFAECAGCRREFDSALLLKELLGQHKPRDPGEDYWSETTALIRARTTESLRQSTRVTDITASRSLERGAFTRSLVSVAASLVVLFSAILLGTGHEQRLARINATEPPVYIAAALEEVVDSDNTVIVTRDENERLTHGMLLLGAPGSIGRFVSPMVMASSTD
ncbi:MAG: zf-HC2 domain-containing protein [Candidatus Zixiibacteriota bacterium]|nr:MAG: zf-HC2 domain-containing protein [candidate division Zixibacteria bacterium]